MHTIECLKDSLSVAALGALCCVGGAAAHAQLFLSGSTFTAETSDREVM